MRWLHETLLRHATLGNPYLEPTAFLEDPARAPALAVNAAAPAVAALLWQSVDDGGVAAAEYVDEPLHRREGGWTGACSYGCAMCVWLVASARPEPNYLAFQMSGSAKAREPKA